MENIQAINDAHNVQASFTAINNRINASTISLQASIAALGTSQSAETQRISGNIDNLVNLFNTGMNEFRNRCISQ